VGDTHADDVARRPELMVEIDYTNWRGERSTRRVVPVRLRFGANEWHWEPQWLLDAWDTGKGAARTLAVAGIHSWKATPGGAACPPGGSVR
jgi:predicted DNA-binding transcriptional regulator YafY